MKAKGRRSLKKGQLIESITLEEALELFALPRDLGQLDGEELMVAHRQQYGPTRALRKIAASLAKTDSPTITYDRAVEIVRAQAGHQAWRPTRRSFPEDPDMLGLTAAGPYIAYEGQELPPAEGRQTKELTLDECLESSPDRNSRPRTTTKRKP